MAGTFWGLVTVLKNLYLTGGVAPTGLEGVDLSKKVRRTGE